MGTEVYQDGYRLTIRTKEKSHKHIPHCHAIGQGFEARIHLETFELLTNTGFSKNDIRKITDAIRYYQVELMEKWKEYHGKI